MKHTDIIEDARYSFAEMNSSLQNHFNNINQEEPADIKLANEYYKWATLKTNLIMNEKNFQIPFSALPNTIKNSSFQWLHTDKQSVISQYYQYNRLTDKYIISVKKSIVPQADIKLIMRSLILVRKTVIWVEFGYKIGTEFGGRHPAIILKNLKDSLIVIPLSSQMPKTLDYNIKVDKVYGFPEMPRWANVTRITQINLSRVHFEKFGDVKPDVLKEIGQKLISCGIIPA